MDKVAAVAATNELEAEAAERSGTLAEGVLVVVAAAVVVVVEAEEEEEANEKEEEAED